MKCTPKNMKANLKIVGWYTERELDFIVVPVRDLKHKTEMIDYARKVLIELMSAEKAVTLVADPKTPHLHIVN